MNAFFYPFHLCHARTLHQLLVDYQQVHFRDYMALQLSPMMGTLAYPDRMGDDYPDLLASGKIVQGHSVSGSMHADLVNIVNRDLADQTWRSCFHAELMQSQQFQRGLVTFAQDADGRSTKPLDPNALLQLQQQTFEHEHFNVEMIQALSGKPVSKKDNSHYEYGFALIKTSASLHYTIQLCHELNLAAVTDSASHHRLLERTSKRDNIDLVNHCIKREGY